MRSMLLGPARPSDRYMSHARCLCREADLLAHGARLDALTRHQGQHLRQAAEVARRRARARMTSAEARDHG